MVTVIVPADQRTSVTYASLAASLETGTARVIQDRRHGGDRRQQLCAREHGSRERKRRQSLPMVIPIRVVWSV